MMAIKSAGEMEFVWNDGGRAASGFVGLTGDCVTRSVAIATGKSYRSVYDAMRQASGSSPRDGISSRIAEDYLCDVGFQREPLSDVSFIKDWLPKGIVVASLVSDDGRSRHFCTIIDHVVHDTWNPADDEYSIVSMWTPTEVSEEAQRQGLIASRAGGKHDSDLTQSEFDKIMKRLVALDRTASNSASTEGEKRNALRMMQNLMLRHNLSREDITEDDNTDNVLFTRIACPLNGRRACRWESRLAAYVTGYVFPMVQYYHDRKNKRTFYWFYGPKDDVQNCIALFRELLLTIATAAHLQYGGYARGSGASYCEGYVRGLPRDSRTAPNESPDQIVSENALIHARTLAIQQAAGDWLRKECGIHLVSSRGSGRSQYDEVAAGKGMRDGATHEMPAGNQQLRITER